jgi:hypothetical protein
MPNSTHVVPSQHPLEHDSVLHPLAAAVPLSGELTPGTPLEPPPPAVPLLSDALPALLAATGLLLVPGVPSDPVIGEVEESIELSPSTPLSCAVSEKS